MEDTKLKESDLLILGVKIQVVEAVKVLTKTKGVPYEMYIREVAANEIARKVKIADINHNLSGTPTEKQKEKYKIALSILTKAE